MLLSDRLRAKKGPWPWREAVAITRDLGVMLAVSEETGVFPGPLTPDTIWIEETTEGPRAELAGDRSKRGAGEASPQWCPPDQADGAPWDDAANRWSLGHVLYRMIAGERPFGGAGLRHAIDEARHREAPPFVDAIARELPAGLQSLVLRSMSPDPRERPESAARFVALCDGFLSGQSEPPAPASREARPHAELPRSIEPSRSAREEQANPPPRAARVARAKPAPAIAPAPAWRAYAARFWPIGAGALAALVAFTQVEPAKPKAAAPVVAPAPPLSADRTTATDCASCHPRQASEWRRSVMAHAVKSPLFNGLESLIEEQVGRDRDCPNGAGILRRAGSATACREPSGNRAITGSGGEHWCVNCHSPTEKLEGLLPPWEGRAGGDPRSRRPVRDLLGQRGIEGISCMFCHAVHGPVPRRGEARGGYEGNPTWTSFVTGAVFAMRPEDGRGLPGIGNSGYELRIEDFLLGRGAFGAKSAGAHLYPPQSAKNYLRSSEFCGSCHDVRLFGTDTLGAAKGEHFKRLRNAYSEWAAWAETERRKGKSPASCQDCHMSAFPGVCEPGEGAADDPCPKGTRFVARAPGVYPEGAAASTSSAPGRVVTHSFSGVDLPLSREYPDLLLHEDTVDRNGIPLSPRRRRDMLLRATFRFALDARRSGVGIEIPIEIENVGAGHRVPAGFSQEREIWVHVTVRSGDGRVLYEAGRVDRVDEDLHDKEFVRVTTRDDVTDGFNRPLGVFGADVRDGRDVPLWQPPPELGGTSFRGKGLINFQNGFLRCVRCIGTVNASGRCEPLPGQNDHRAARFADGIYDLDTGSCSSNLSGANALFETYFPVGSLDASRGLVKGPDAIIDTRSLPPGVPLRYVYDLPLARSTGPLRVEARLLFRAFPPFLIKAFAAYEAEQARKGLRPSGPLVTFDMLKRLEVVEIARAERTLQ